MAAVDKTVVANRIVVVVERVVADKIVATSVLPLSWKHLN
jgi:hypothetical protein